MSSPPEQSAWMCAAHALLAGDAAALESACSRLPGAAARALRTLATLPGGGRGVPPAGLPAQVEWVGDERFAAFFARDGVVFGCETPGRELLTGCYIAPGGRAEFRLEAGECRFVILRRKAERA